MKFVLDASVAIKVVLPEPDSKKATDLLRSHAPDILYVEVAHALTKAEQRNLIAKGHSFIKLADITKSKAIVHPYVPLLSRAVEISSQMRVGVYDCLYVALAEQENCELVTADTRLIRSLPVFPIRDVASLP